MTAIKQEMYFKTTESKMFQFKIEPKNTKYHIDLFDFLGIDLEKTENRKYLDVGCALGGLMKYFEANGFEVYGCDVSKYAISECSKIFRPKQLALADACEEIPFKEKFGIVTCFGVLGVIKKSRQLSFLKNCFDMLDSGGIFIATAPNAERPIFLRKLTGREKSYDNSRTVREWRLLMANFEWRSLSVEAIQRILLSKSIFGKNFFVKIPFGDPVVIVGIKK